MTQLDKAILAENQAILSRFAAEGSDLSQERVIDFEHVFETKTAADVFCNLAEAGGYTPTLYKRDDGRWDAQASTRMVPTAESITQCEVELGELASQHGGYKDGWGFFRSP
jgi:hypothetical protein